MADPTGAEILREALNAERELALAEKDVREALRCGEDVEEAKNAVSDWKAERELLLAALARYRAKLEAAYGAELAARMLKADATIAQATTPTARREAEKARAALVPPAASTGATAPSPLAGAPSLGPDGLVWVGDQPVRLPERDRPIFRAQVRDRWGKLIVENSIRAKVDAALIAGLIWAESTGRPELVSRDGGYGLMQLTHPSAFQGLPPASSLQPATNIKLGTDVLAQLQRRGDVRPWALASRYNAGTAADGSAYRSDVSPWFMRASGTHITRTMGAYNEWKILGRSLPLPTEKRSWVMPALMGLGAVAAGAWWLTSNVGDE